MAAGIISRRNNINIETDHNLTLPNGYSNGKIIEMPEYKTKTRRSFPGFGLCGQLNISSTRKSVLNESLDTSKATTQCSCSAIKLGTPRDKLKDKSKAATPTLFFNPNRSVKGQRYRDALTKKKPELNLLRTPKNISQCVEVAKHHQNADSASGSSRTNSNGSFHSALDKSFEEYDTASSGRLRSGANDGTDVEITPATIKHNSNQSRISSSDINNERELFNAEHPTPVYAAIPEEQSVGNPKDNHPKRNITNKELISAKGNVIIVSINESVSNDHYETMSRRDTLIYQGSRLIKSIKKRFSLPGMKSKTFSTEHVYYPRSSSWASSSDLKLNRRSRAPDDNVDSADDVITVTSDSVLSARRDWKEYDKDSLSDASSELMELVDKISAFNTATSSSDNDSYELQTKNEHLCYEDTVRRQMSRTCNRDNLVQDTCRQIRGSVSEMSVDDPLAEATLMEDQGEGSQRIRRNFSKEYIDENTIQCNKLRRKKVIKIKRSRNEGLSIASSIQLVFELPFREIETEIVSVIKEGALADLLYEQVEQRGLTLEQIEVFLESSRTPLSLLTESQLFTECTLYIRVKDEEKRSLTALLPLPTLNTASLNRDKKQQLNGSVKSKKSVSSSEDGASSYTDISPYSTLRRRDPASTGTASKQPSKLQSLFNPFNKTQDKQEQLNDLLNQYSTLGLPKMPDLLTLGRPHYEPCSFQLESHWSDIVSNHQNLNKRQRDHQEAVWELLNTEVEYIRNLRVIIDLFMCCLFNLQNEQILNEIEADKLFSNICDVYYATCHFWKSHMSQVLRHSRETRDMLNPCLLKAGFLVFDKICEPYTKYCLEQDVCREYIKAKTKENDLFRTFITWAESHKQCGRLKLADLIVKPWQRLTKYKLLLYAIRKPLEKMDPSPHVEETCEDINLMMNQVEKFVHQVNIAMKQRHQCKQLSLMIDRIESYDVVDAPNDECVKLINEFCKLDLNCPVPGFGQHEMRILLLEGNLKLKDTYSKTDVYCFLFTDMLLITKPAARRGDKVKVIKPPMRLDKIVAHSLRDLTSFMLLYLNEYHMAQAIYTFHGDSKLWLDTVNKAQIEYKEKRHAYLTRNDAVIMDLYENTEEEYPPFVDRLQSMEPTTDITRVDSCSSADTYLPNCPGEDPDRVHSTLKSQMSAPSGFSSGNMELKPPVHRLASYRSELVTNVDDYKNPITGRRNGDRSKEESGGEVGDGKDQTEGGIEEGKGRRNQRRLDRTERRYHTADTVQEMNRRRRRDTGVHKRLSWNSGADAKPRTGGETGEVTALSQAESVRSMPSSSGVGSSMSLYHQDDDIDEEEPSESDQESPDPPVYKCDAETQTQTEILTSGLYDNPIARWIPYSEGDIHLLEQSRLHSKSLPNFVEVTNGHNNGHRVTAAVPAGSVLRSWGGGLEPTGIQMEGGNGLSCTTQRRQLSPTQPYLLNKEMMMCSASMEAS